MTAEDAYATGGNPDFPDADRHTHCLKHGTNSSPAPAAHEIRLCPIPVISTIPIFHFQSIRIYKINKEKVNFCINI